MESYCKHSCIGSPGREVREARACLWRSEGVLRIIAGEELNLSAPMEHVGAARACQGKQGIG